MGVRTSYLPGTFCWTDLATSDVAGATTFYTELFGWRTDALPGAAAGDYTLLLVGDALVAALYSAGESMHPAWLSYVSVVDADATAAQAVELGGSVLREAADIATSGRMALLADPTGAVFAAWQARDHVGAALVNEPGSLVLNQLNTSDPEAAGRFYTELFGWRVEHTGTDEQAYWGFYNGEEISGATLNGGMMPLPPGTPAPPHWLVYFTAAELDTAVARIADLGGRVLVAPMTAGGGRILVAADPQGAIFALFEGRVDP
jgi:predicted enzyme related to lactoylglutathione lyase